MDVTDKETGKVFRLTSMEWVSFNEDYKNGISPIRIKDQDSSITRCTDAPNVASLPNTGNNNATSGSGSNNAAGSSN